MAPAPASGWWLLSLVDRLLAVLPTPRAPWVAAGLRVQVHRLAIEVGDPRLLEQLVEAAEQRARYPGLADETGAFGGDGVAAAVP